jgi:molybdopterin molybdotransferase
MPKFGNEGKKMISASDAELLILSLVQPLDSDRDTEQVSLLNAAGRILARTIISNLDFPHWDNSAMDGYAVRYTDVERCSAENPITLTIIEEIPAGTPPQKVIQPGQAARILTGSMLPEGADTVVMQEETRREGDRVTVLTPPNPNAFVRHRGTYYQAGNPLLPAGCQLQSTEIAVLAAAQQKNVTVYRRPRVAILSTGNELVSIDQPLQPGQLVDSNQYALATLVTQAGADAIPLGIIPDDPEALKAAIAQAVATADIVLSSGGVSVGDYDFVDQILATLGADFHIRSVAIKPGKPLTVATVPARRSTETSLQTPPPLSPSSSSLSPPSPSPPPLLSPTPTLYFGLPGNPVSALVCFWRFVQPALKKLSGLPAPWEVSYVNAIATQPLKSDGKRESYIWGHLTLKNGSYHFDPAGGTQNSGNLINLIGITGLAVLPVGTTAIAPGAIVPVLPL